MGWFSWRSGEAVSKLTFSPVFTKGFNGFLNGWATIKLPVNILPPLLFGKEIGDQLLEELRKQFLEAQGVWCGLAPGYMLFLGWQWHDDKLKHIESLFMLEKPGNVRTTDCSWTFMGTPQAHYVWSRFLEMILLEGNWRAWKGMAAQ